MVRICQFFVSVNTKNIIERDNLMIFRSISIRSCTGEHFWGFNLRCEISHHRNKFLAMTLEINDILLHAWKVYNRLQVGEGSGGERLTPSNNNEQEVTLKYTFTVTPFTVTITLPNSSTRGFWDNLFRLHRGFAYTSCELWPNIRMLYFR